MKAGSTGGKKTDVGVNERVESGARWRSQQKDELHMLKEACKHTHCTHAHTHTLYLLSINSVCCRAIGEAIASSPMVSVIEVHASFRRPSCLSLLSSLLYLLTILLLPRLPSPHLAFPRFLLIIMFCVYGIFPPLMVIILDFLLASLLLLSFIVDIDWSITLRAQSPLPLVTNGVVYGPMCHFLTNKVEKVTKDTKSIISFSLIYNPSLGLYSSGVFGNQDRNDSTKTLLLLHCSDTNWGSVLTKDLWWV